MKRKLKVIAAMLLVLIMFISAMPMQLTAEAMTPPTTRYATPDGYNDHDYQKMVAFFEQTDENSVRNGEKLSEDYDPTDPGTWWKYDDGYCRGSVEWTTVAGEYRLYNIFFGGIGNDALPLELVGFLDVSGCTALAEVRCWSFGDIQLTGLDVSGCAALEALDCDGNELTELDVSGCAALEELDCDYNHMTELDVSANTGLRRLYCSGNQLTELDVSANTELESLSCSENHLTELDLSNNPRIDIDTISAEGSGFIGVGTERDENYDKWYCIKAVPVPGNSFCGWYAVDGTLLSTNVEINRNDFDGVNDFVAKFTASTPGGIGDVDGDGVVRVSDAVLIMRCALGLIEFTPEQILCGDVDGDGVIKIADAVMVVRIALGLV
ncbi:MAG: dockerin type I domain-containing protein [Christensenellales bacterium]